MDVKKIFSSSFVSRNRLRSIMVGAILFLSVIFIWSLYSRETLRKIESADDFTKHMDNAIPLLMDKYDIPGVNVALVKGGKTIWSNAYGYADIGKERRMTVDTYCRVESISKPVTAWGVMKLVEQGKIQLDSPVIQYINNWEFPENKFSVENITVRQLLSHTAGMPLGDVFERYSPQEKIPSLRDSLTKGAVLVREPGETFSYSNEGFNLLELLIEEVTGRDFGEYMEEEVLIPLGMNNSSFNWSEKMEPGVPLGYDLKGNPIPVYIYPEKASGGLISQVEDIATFVGAGMPDFTEDNKVLKAESINRLYTSEAEDIGIFDLVFNSYGMGHYIEVLSGDKIAVSHGGQGGGYMTHFISVPETGDGMVVFTNSQRSWPFIAYILRDWAQWNGFGSVGMGKIIWAQRLMWVFIGIIWIIVLWQAFNLIKGLIEKRRRFLWISMKCGIFRLFEAVLAIAIFLLFLWCISQDYVFLAAVFPVLYDWILFSLLPMAGVLLLTTIFPHAEQC